VIARLGEHLAYVWTAVVVQPGRHSIIRSRMIRSGHRSVLIFSNGDYRPGGWIFDTVVSELVPAKQLIRGSNPRAGSDARRALQPAGRARPRSMMGSGTTRCCGASLRAPVHWLRHRSTGSADVDRAARRRVEGGAVMDELSWPHRTPLSARAIAPFSRDSRRVGSERCEIRWVPAGSGLPAQGKALVGRLRRSPCRSLRQARQWPTDGQIGLPAGRRSTTGSSGGPPVTSSGKGLETDQRIREALSSLGGSCSPGELYTATGIPQRQCDGARPDGQGGRDHPSNSRIEFTLAGRANAARPLPSSRGMPSTSPPQSCSLSGTRHSPLLADAVVVRCLLPDRKLQPASLPSVRPRRRSRRPWPS